MTAALGWLGMAGTFLAYLLLWRGRVASESLTYALLNAVGGVLGGAASALYGAWPSAVSNLVWATIGLQSIVHATTRRAQVSTDAAGDGPDSESPRYDVGSAGTSAAASASATSAAYVS